MAARRKRRSVAKEKHLLSPLEGGVVDKIQPLLQYSRPLPPPGTYAEVFLLLKNNTDRRIEVTADDELLARAAFDLRGGLRFLVDGGD